MINFNPKNCIGCLSCMTIKECRMYLDSIRHGGPIFKKPDCTNCTKCIDFCGRALSKNEK